MAGELPSKRLKALSAFTRESDLCAAFLEAVARDLDWTAYSETAGFDILLVRKDGIQIGIEAKLTLNAKVLSQALPEWSRYAHGGDSGQSGPHYRAVLVPEEKIGNHIPRLCSALGITVIEQRGADRSRSVDPFWPALPRADHRHWHNDCWYEWCPLKPCPLPDYVPDCGAGNPSPIALTPWKIAAIKLMILLEERPVTRADFKHLGLSPSRWTDPFTGWLKPTELGYVRGPRLPDFAAHHPLNYEQIKADRAKWMPPVPAVQRQNVLPLDHAAGARP